MWKFPVFVRSKDCGDVNSYSSVEEMNHDLERIDVENEEYEAWDATGLPLKLSVQGSSKWLHLDAAENPERERLAAAITAFAGHQSIRVDTSHLFASGFPAALAQITSAIQAKRQTQSWWQNFKRRF